MVHTLFPSLVTPVPNPWDTMHYPVTELPGLPRNPGETAPDYITRASAVLETRRHEGTAPPAPASIGQSNVSAVFVEVGETGQHEA
jgi:hypothetical protein